MLDKQTGVTLIEALVALLVLSIGLLGTAHLMAVGVKHTNSSYARTQAVFIAENLAERMRANPEGITNGNYNGINSTAINCAALPNPYCQARGGATASCDFDQQATFDAFQAACGDWDGAKGVNGITTQIPGGRLTVTCNVAPCLADSLYTISVFWNETEDVNGADALATKQIDYVIQP